MPYDERGMYYEEPRRQAPQARPAPAPRTTPRPVDTVVQPGTMPYDAEGFYSEQPKPTSYYQFYGRQMMDLPSGPFPSYRQQWEDELPPAGLSMLEREGFVRPASPPIGPAERPQYRPNPWNTETPQWRELTPRGEFVRDEALMGEYGPSVPPQGERPYLPMMPRGGGFVPSSDPMIRELGLQGIFPHSRYQFDMPMQPRNAGPRLDPRQNFGIPEDLLLFVGPSSTEKRRIPWTSGPYEDREPPSVWDYSAPDYKMPLYREDLTQKSEPIPTDPALSGWMRGKELLQREARNPNITIRVNPWRQA